MTSVDSKGNVDFRRWSAGGLTGTVSVKLTVASPVCRALPRTVTSNDRPIYVTSQDLVIFLLKQEIQSSLSSSTYCRFVPWMGLEIIKKFKVLSRLLLTADLYHGWDWRLLSNPSACSKSYSFSDSPSQMESLGYKL
jgi:hypothetical protein